MIKRQFYKQERGDRDDSGSDDSSSSSDSEAEVEADVAEADVAEAEFSEEETKAVSDVEESESSSDSADSLSSDRSVDESEFGAAKKNTKHGRLTSKRSADVWKTNILQQDDSLPADFASYILKCKSVFKCKLCPKVVCLTEETLKTHLKSKGHARSVKLLKEGKLKSMLNSDGEIEEEPETHAERHARILALAQDAAKPASKNKGRQRQKQRRLKRKRAALQSGAVAEQGSKKKDKK